MLDKSVPFLNILMCRPPEAELPLFELPEGYAFSMFQPGDEKEWAEIEASVLEFPRGVDALVHFEKRFLYAPHELERRCLFIEDPQGKKIATATIWWEYSGKRRDPWVSYVAVMPQYQGLGLSKALLSRLLQLSEEIEGKRKIYLHTQTWSHRAVKLYEKFGFYITKEPNLFKYANDQYEQATALLEEIYSKYPRR